MMGIAHYANLCACSKPNGLSKLQMKRGELFNESPFTWTRFEPTLLFCHGAAILRVISENFQNYNVQSKSINHSHSLYYHEPNRFWLMVVMMVRAVTRMEIDRYFFSVIHFLQDNT
jgi:hypothetical protein